MAKKQVVDGGKDGLIDDAGFENLIADLVSLVGKGTIRITLQIDIGISPSLNGDFASDGA